MKWFHRLRNPHCPDCIAEDEDNKVCLSCDTLRTELAAVRRHNEQLMETLIEQFGPRQISQEQVEVKIPIDPKTLSWRARRQILEANDKREAEILRARDRELAGPKIEQLEEELLPHIEEEDASKIG